MLAGFSWALVTLRDNPRIASCNCFGMRPRDLRDGLARNGALAALSVALVVSPADGPVWSASLQDLVAAATVALGAVCCWQLAGALGLTAGSARR